MHDLRQPLQTIRLLADSSHVGMAVSEIEAMLALLGQVSALETGDVSPKREAFRIPPIVQSLAQRLEQQIDQAGATLTLSVADLTVRTDKHLLVLTMEGMILFALKHANRKAVAVTAARCNAKACSIDIRFAGPVRADAFARRAFVELPPPPQLRSVGGSAQSAGEARARAEPPSSSVALGPALGRIVAKHLGGKLAQSKARDGMWVLSLRLPLANDAMT